MLRRLGLDVGERELAMACGTSSCGGTSAALLAHTLREQFHGTLNVEFKHCDSVAQLPGIGGTTGCYALAVIKLTPFVDHFVALLDFQGDSISVGDPLAGLQKMSLDEFSES